MDVIAVALEFDLFGGEDRLFAVPVVFQGDIIDDEFAVEVDGNFFTNHFDSEGVPLSDGFIGG